MYLNSEHKVYDGLVEKAIKLHVDNKVLVVFLIFKIFFQANKNPVNFVSSDHGLQLFCFHLLWKKTLTFGNTLIIFDFEALISIRQQPWQACS